MRWRVFTFAAAVSSLICIATAVIWVRSYFAYDEIVYISNSRRSLYGISTQPSCVYLVSSVDTPSKRPNDYNFVVPNGFHRRADVAMPNWDSGVAPTAVSWTFARFAWVGAGERDVYPKERVLIVPCYAIVALSAILPATWIRSFRARKRRAARITAQLCIECGYDLRTTPERCPECGAVPLIPKSAH